MLADTKKRSDEYRAQKETGTTTSQPQATFNTVTANKGTFEF